MNYLLDLPDDILEMIFLINHKKQMNKITKILEHPSISYKNYHNDGFSWGEIVKSVKAYEGVIAHTF